MCPHCERKFQFPGATTEGADTLAFVDKRESTAAASRGSPRSKSQAPATPKGDVKKKPSVKSKSPGKEKPVGKEKPAGVNLKTLASKIAIGVVVLVASLYFFVGRKRDYTADRQAVLSYISSTMPKAKFDSWHGEGMAKGCTTTNGVKIPDNGVVVRAHVMMPGRLKYKKDIVFIVVNGRVTDEIDPQNFRLPAGSGK